ncbi:SDR family NAD(P)-dependent oxidoreductase [Vibrio salinus]|uniref:SDR family NAD(P)-dependent oxidoreductase n=1 Tax=Vibrio salinus TaxID=2899784 RepID=UPI001E4660E7|nr:SDR family NAD(P)-dependent oxidoreductase [Vibrio salinus]MCE0494699.1 SDR family NAD(P)-dependent oxidoreductase [Vibrio salinus]
MTYKNIVVTGSSGAIGSAFIRQVAERYPDATIHAFSRQGTEPTLAGVKTHSIDYTDENSIDAAVQTATQLAPVDLMLVATGLLHHGHLMPEKSLKELTAAKLHDVFEANTIVPALFAKHFLPRMNRKERSVFAVLSARVGSISDNRLGGWYAYRASKAALNMIIKNAAIETGRLNKNAIVAGLHPGTVDSRLSQPFQSKVSEKQLFTPEESARHLLNVIHHLTPEQSGRCFAWDGKEIQP